MKDYLSYSDIARGAPIDFKKVGKVTAESVHKHTGKDWRQWIGILEKAGAEKWKYAEIVVYLAKKHRLTPWWQHGVALGFEIASGRRKTGQDAKGKYMVTATKSLSRSVREVWKFLISDEGQSVWLKPIAPIEVQPKSQFETDDGYFGEIRTLAAARRLRMYLQDPLWEKHTVLELMLVNRPGKKSILVFNHTGIVDAKTLDVFRLRWRKAADQIGEFLE